MAGTGYVYLSLDTPIRIAGRERQTLRDLMNEPDVVMVSKEDSEKDFAEHLQRAIDGNPDCGMFAAQMRKVSTKRKYTILGAAVVFAISAIAFLVMQHHGFGRHWVYPVGFAVISLGVAWIVSLWSSPAARKGAAVFASCVGALLLLAGFLAVFALFTDRPKQFARIALEMQGELSDSLSQVRIAEQADEEGVIRLKGGGTVTCTNATNFQVKP